MIECHPACDWRLDGETIVNPKTGILKVFPRWFSVSDRVVYSNKTDVVEDYQLYSWDMWNPHANKKMLTDLCHSHHDLVVKLWQEEMAYDVWVQERTDEYFASTDGTIPRDKLYGFASR